MNIFVILAIAGIILAAVLTLLLIYFLQRFVEKWKEFLKRKTKSLKGSLINFKQLEVPQISYRTVNAQQPFIKSDFYLGKQLHVNSTKRFSNSLIAEYLTKRVSVSDGYESSDATSVYSMPIEQRNRESQELISNNLMNYLKLLSKDSMRKFSQDSNYSWTDQSGSSQNEEMFESTTVGESKKQVASFQRKNSLLKQIFKLTGHLTYRSSYSQENKVLTVHILRLMDIASEKPVSEVNLFVRAYLLPGKMHKQNSKYQIGKKNPFIDEKMVFPDILKEDMNKYKLKLKVYNHSRLLRSELLGKVEIALSSMDLNASETFAVDLFLKVQKKGSRPLLMVSLNNQATSSKLEVIIHKAKNLPKSTNYIYAIVSLIKYDYFEMKDTALRLCSNHVDFNEFLEFDFYTCIDSPLQSYSLVISLVNSKAVGGDQIIGHVIFSECFPHSATASHWKNIENTPHKRITEWHSLIGPEIS